MLDLKSMEFNWGKLIILIIIIAILIAGFFFTKNFINNKEKASPLEKIKGAPLTAKEQIIKKHSFIIQHREDISKFLMDLYDPKSGKFKNDKFSSPTLEATSLGVEILSNFNKLSLIKDSIPIFEYVKSFYLSDGYYIEKNNDPVFSTRQSLVIDKNFSEDLNQNINLDWLKRNSLENKDIEKSKLEPEYQAAVLDIYRFLGGEEKLKALSYIYFDYYCKIVFPDGISDSEYLLKKYYQVKIISTISGFNKLDQNLIDNCFGRAQTSNDTIKLNNMKYNNFKDIKDVYRLYYLNNFYNIIKSEELVSCIEGVFEYLENFYLQNGIKENINDDKPSLVGVYYATLFLE